MGVESIPFFCAYYHPENYLSLYNFGFAQSQGLPVLSKGLIDKFTFGLRLSGNGKEATFSSRIVGFSAKINSILVPEDFLSWQTLPMVAYLAGITPLGRVS